MSKQDSDYPRLAMNDCSPGHVRQRPPDAKLALGALGRNLLAVFK
jgi:hypothetical protein